MIWPILALALVAGGHYEGVCDQGRVTLTLGLDGAARYGGADFTWRREGEALILAPAEGPALTLQITEGPGEIVLTGPPFGRLWLRPTRLPGPAAAPTPPAEPPPAEAAGRWRYSASGGTLILELNPSGAFRMIQRFESPLAGAPGPDRVSVGRWTGQRGAADALILIPHGGGPVTYRFQRAGGRLLIRGGDLPTMVGFEQVQGDQIADPPPTSREKRQ